MITFPSAPTLLIEAEVDGSDELHVSYAGARWVHKHWGFPAFVKLNGVEWNPAVIPFLLNDGESTFLPEPVRFENAGVLEVAGRDLMTVRTVADGLIVNFADNPVGAGSYAALISFPAAEALPAGLIPVVTSAELQTMNNAAISIKTVRGAWYELEFTENLGANAWSSTGAFVRGNGSVMTLFDPLGASAARFYRVIASAQL